MQSPSSGSVLFELAEVIVDYILITNLFRASSARLQEDTVVYMQHMVLSFCKQVSGLVLLKHDLLVFPI